MILGISLSIFAIVFFLPLAAIKVVEFGWVKQLETAFLIAAIVAVIIIYIYGLWYAVLERIVS